MTALPDIKSVPITSDTQFVLLACDGVWDVKTSQAAISFAAKNVFDNQFGGKRTTEELIHGMCDLLDSCCAKDLTSSQGLGCDNISAILVEI